MANYQILKLTIVFKVTMVNTLMFPICRKSQGSSRAHLKRKLVLTKFQNKTCLLQAGQSLHLLLQSIMGRSRRLWLTLVSHKYFNHLKSSSHIYDYKSELCLKEPVWCFLIFFYLLLAQLWGFKKCF